MSRKHTQPTALAVGTLAKLPDLEAIALDCGFIVRNHKKFSAEGFLLTLLKAISTGNASFSQMAASLGEHEVRSLSRQALHQRMKPELGYTHHKHSGGSMWSGRSGPAIPTALGN